MIEKGYDPACEDLALHFLADETPPPSEAKLRSLAQAIQDAVEAWFFDDDFRRAGEEKRP